MGLKIVWPVVRMLFPISFRSWSFPWNGHFNFLASWNKILTQEMKAKVMGIGLEYGEITTSFIWITRIWGMKSIPAVGQAGPRRMAAEGWVQKSSTGPEKLEWKYWVLHFSLLNSLLFSLRLCHHNEKIGEGSVIAHAGAAQWVVSGKLYLEGGRCSDPASFMWGQAAGRGGKHRRTEQAVWAFLGKAGKSLDFLLCVFKFFIGV